MLRALWWTTSTTTLLTTDWKRSHTARLFSSLFYIYICDILYYYVYIYNLCVRCGAERVAHSLLSRARVLRKCRVQFIFPTAGSSLDAGFASRQAHQAVLCARVCTRALIPPSRQKKILNRLVVPFRRHRPSRRRGVHFACDSAAKLRRRGSFPTFELIAVHSTHHHGEPRFEFVLWVRASGGKKTRMCSASRPDKHEANMIEVYGRVRVCLKVRNYMLWSVRSDQIRECNTIITDTGSTGQCGRWISLAY